MYVGWIDSKLVVKYRLSNPDMQQEVHNGEAPRKKTLHNRRVQIWSRKIEHKLSLTTQQKRAKLFNHVTCHDVFIKTQFQLYINSSLNYVN